MGGKGTIPDFFKDTSGNVLGQAFNQALSTAVRARWTTLGCCGGLPDSWDQADSKVLDFVYIPISAAFPAVRLCELNWKLRQWCINKFSGWRRGWLAKSIPAPIKRVRSSSIAAEHKAERLSKVMSESNYYSIISLLTIGMQNTAVLSRMRRMQILKWSRLELQTTGLQAYSSLLSSPSSNIFGSSHRLSFASHRLPWPYRSRPPPPRPPLLICKCPPYCSRLPLPFFHRPLSSRNHPPSPSRTPPPSSCSHPPSSRSHPLSSRSHPLSSCSHPLSSHIRYCPLLSLICHCLPSFCNHPPSSNRTPPPPSSRSHSLLSCSYLLSSRICQCPLSSCNHLLSCSHTPSLSSRSHPLSCSHSTSHTCTLMFLSNQWTRTCLLLKRSFLVISMGMSMTLRWTAAPLHPGSHCLVLSHRMEAPHM
jgi:hypothetical protein